MPERFLVRRDANKNRERVPVPLDACLRRQSLILLGSGFSIFGGDLIVFA